ncbi:MAG: ATP:cob(I)alamin adenosyltransferase [Actinobacteria bacterium]|nr:ATP:cob(I)alamin adenosyltransferase [Actinomycetota bacterium]
MFRACGNSLNGAWLARRSTPGKATTARPDSSTEAACRSVIGLVRVAAGHGSEVDSIVVPIMRDLWVLMAELATLPENRHKLTPGRSCVTSEMVDRLEAIIDDLDTKFEPPTEFVVPGEHPVSAWLDFARTTVRRAERQAFGAAPPPSYVVPYLNRLSDLLWTMARWQEGVSRPVSSL